MARIRLKHAQVKWDEKVIPRVKVSDAVVSDYEQIGREDKDALPPVDVFAVGDGKFLGVDGRHRWLAAEARGDKEILCEVHKGTVADAIWFASGANCRHGVRLSNDDKRRAAINCLSNESVGGTRSDSQIAVQIGCGASLISLVRKSIAAAAKKAEKAKSEPKAAQPTAKPKEPTKRTAKRNGKEYEIDVSKIGKSKGSVPKMTKAQKAAAAKEVLKDGLNQEVSDLFRPVAIAAVGIDGFLTELGGLVKKVEGLAAGPCGREIDVKGFADFIQTIRQHFKASRFYCCCPECLARDKIAKSCGCGGLGWLTRKQYEKIYLEPK